MEAGYHGMMDYKQSGGVITLRFDQLFKELGIYGIES